MVEKNFTNNGEELTTFQEGGSKRTPIQSALTRPLVEVVGKCFLLLSGATEMAENPSDATKKIPRAVYDVRTISSNTKLPIGTVLTVKVKGSQSILGDEENKKLLLGLDKNKVVAFDNLSHWFFNGSEGLSASQIRILDLTAQDAMKL